MIIKPSMSLAFSALILLFIGGSAIATEQKDTELPLEAFIKHSDYLDIKLSPDGKHFAARVREKDRVFLTMVEIDGVKYVGGINPGRFNEVRNPQWVNNERIVFKLAEKQRDRDRPSLTGELYGISIDGKQSEVLAGFRAGDEKTGTRISNREDSPASFEVISTLADDPKKVLIVEHRWESKARYWYDTRKAKPIVSRMHAYSGRKSKVETIDYPNSDLFAGTDGNVKFLTQVDDTYDRVALFRQSKGADWQSVESEFDLDSDDLEVAGINDAGDRVFLRMTDQGSGVNTIFELNLSSKEVLPLFDNQVADISYWMTDQYGNVKVGVSYPDSATYHYVGSGEDAFSRLHRSLVKAFGGQEVDIESIAEDGMRAIVRVSSDVNPGEYYLFDTQTKRADFLWANSSWIDPRVMQPKQPVSLEMRDGSFITGYLTLPQGASDLNKAPLIVMPHGGPHGIRDYPFFDWEVQLLANRGYAVLQPNYRGSGGFGDEFVTAGYRQWGGLMIDDIVDATSAALASFPLDTNRVCIYGASYGGYAALMAAAREPDLYQCTVGYAGVYDLTIMSREGDIPLYFSGPAFLEMVLGSDAEELAEFSPVNHADKIKADVLLIHGRKDIRTPIEHYDRMRDAFDEAGKDYDAIKISNAGHGVWSYENRETTYTKLLDFLDQSIGGQ